MEKNYRSNKRLKEYVEQNVAKMGINAQFSPLLVDVMLRRFSEFDFTDNEIYKDMYALVNNLTEIDVGKMPASSPDAAGVYFYDQRKITISEDYIKKAKTPKDFETLYEIFTHETFHALGRDEYGNAKISTQNSYTDVAYHSLEEAIVEKAADRCVHGRRLNEANSPFFHQNEFGYSDITYITDIIEATYGVSEKAFLRNAIQGRKNAEIFLSAIARESELESLDYLDRLELNYATLHNALYKDKGAQTSNVIKDAMTAGLLVSSWKLSENIERLDVNSEEFQDRIESFKYGHNKMFTVINHATENFDRRFPGNNIKGHILAQIQDTRADNSFRINAISDILKKRDSIPEADFLRLIEAAQSGNRDFGKEENLYQKYQISMEAPEFIPLDSDSYLGFRHADFEITSWDNSQIPEQIQVFKDEYEKMNERSFSTNVKGAFEKIRKVLEKAKQFLGGNYEETKALGPGCSNEVDKQAGANFGELSAEDMEKFTKGMQEVLKQRQIKEQEQDREENVSKYEGPGRE